MKEDVIERVLGYNDYEMWKKCELIRGVINKTIEKREGRGRSVRILKELKYDTLADVRDKIERSCIYYKKLHEESMSNKVKLGSFEVTKYRFEYIDGEPKIVIDRVKVLDTNGKYIKFAKLEGVISHLCKHPIKFKDYDSI